MARIASTARTHAGLYGKLWEREELAARNGGRVIAASGQVYDGTPARLAAFRAGAPVDLPAWAVPEYARAGERRERLTWCRAIVTADGEVTFYADDARRWLAENGL